MYKTVVSSRLHYLNFCCTWIQYNS